MSQLLLAGIVGKNPSVVMVILVTQSRTQSPRAFWSAPRHGALEYNQFPETKIPGLPVSRSMRDLVYMASRDKVDVDTFHKGIQYALEKLGKSKSGFERTAVSNFKSKIHEGSGNELVDYSRAPCLCADQKGTWALGTRLLVTWFLFLS